MVEVRSDISTTATATREPRGWAANEVAGQNRPEIRADAGAEVAKTTDNTARRLLPPGTKLTPDMIEQAGIAKNPDQLFLERNALYRDQNPKAFFQSRTPVGNESTNDKIDQMTGTKGDGTDPANAVGNITLDGQALKNALLIKQYEGAIRIESWRAQHPDMMSDAGFPPRLSAEEIGKSTSKDQIQDAINALYAERGFPVYNTNNIQKFAPMKAYKPDPRFDEETSLNESDKAYAKLLVEKRNQLTGTDAPPARPPAKIPGQPQPS